MSMNCNACNDVAQLRHFEISCSRGFAAMAGFVAVLIAALRAIGVSVSAMAAGFLGARLGIISPQAQKSMAAISMNILIPSLLFTRIIYCDQCNQHLAQCTRCSPFIDILCNSWVLILLPLVVVGIGVFLGKLTAVLTAAPSSFSKGTICPIAFGNSTGLPIVLLTVISQSAASLTPSKQLDPLQHLPVYLMLYPVLQWSIGSWLLADTAGPQAEAVDNDPEISEVESIPSSEASLAQTNKHKCCLRVLQELRNVLQQALTPPVLGALLGLLVSFTPVRAWLVDLRDQDNDAPLQWFYAGLYKLGDAAVPVNLLILGSSLAKGADFHALPCRVGLGIAFSKLILMPGFMVLIVYGLIRIIPNKGYSLWLVALVVSCTPTANNVAVMAQNGGQSKEGMATAIFLQYLFAPICVTLSLAAFIQLLSSDWFLPPV